MNIWPLKQQRDIDQLIFDGAEYQRPADTQELMARVMKTELFAPVQSGALNLPDGTRTIVSASDSIALMTAELGDLE